MTKWLYITKWYYNHQLISHIIKLGVGNKPASQQQLSSTQLCRHRRCSVYGMKQNTNTYSRKCHEGYNILQITKYTVSFTQDPHKHENTHKLLDKNESKKKRRVTNRDWLSNRGGGITQPGNNSCLQHNSVDRGDDHSMGWNKTQTNLQESVMKDTTIYRSLSILYLLHRIHNSKNRCTNYWIKTNLKKRRVTNRDWWYKRGAQYIIRDIKTLRWETWQHMDETE